MLAELQQQADVEGELDWWRLHHVDGTVIRAHQHAAGYSRSERKKEELRRGLSGGDARVGRRFGGSRTKPGRVLDKVYLRAEGTGKSVAILVTAGERHEQSVFEVLMETGAIKRAGRGRSRIWPDRVVGDKGYSSKKIRDYLQQFAI